jgi:hypothetical protein
MGLLGQPSVYAQSSAHPPDGLVDTGCGPWNLSPTPMPVVPMDNITVYAFSQTGNGESDPQVLELSPDIVIRAWAKWDIYGVKFSDYKFSYVTDCQTNHIRFIGGTTATILFADEFNPQAFDRIVCRNAKGEIVNHNNIVPGAHRGSIADPEYRDYLVKIGEVQIDGGVDGLFFDEVDQDYQGEKYDNNEGFDDYHLADFNSYLLAKYPPGTDFAKLFKMPPGNMLRRDLPAGDLRRNFNYLRYLDYYGWSNNPFAYDNPLAVEWGKTYDDHPEPGAKNFVSASEPYRYFGPIVRELKDYAKKKYGKDLLITGNGILPNVDFESIGLWDYNHDGDGGSMADYVPVLDGHLNGARSLQSVFRRFKAQSKVLAPGAPVVLFIDWPTPTLNRYTGLPQNEREDYWRLYAAEAYANGLFYAFHLKTATGEPTADQQGMMPFFKSYTAFYRNHASLYHQVEPSDRTATCSISSAMVAVTEGKGRVLVHLVNHEYDKGFKPQHNVTVTIPLDWSPKSVTVASPDLAGDQALKFGFSEGKLSVVLPDLVAYSVLVVKESKNGN